MKVKEVFKSQAYQNDTRFTSKESKDKYYGFNIWTDRIYIIKCGMFTRCQVVGNEILIQGVDADKLDTDDKALIRHFFEAKDPDRTKFRKLTTEEAQDRAHILTLPLVINKHGRVFWVLREEDQP